MVMLLLAVPGPPLEFSEVSVEILALVWHSPPRELWRFHLPPAPLTWTDLVPRQNLRSRDGDPNLARLVRHDRDELF